MKKIVSIALFIFFAVIVAILIGSLFFSGQNQGSSVSPSSGTTSTPSIEVSPGAKTISLAEVTKHNNANDCWQAISGNVYNFSSYLDQHPAGAEAMIPYCGKDATVAYDTKGGRGDSHSGRAERMLPTYFVGRLSQ